VADDGPSDPQYRVGVLIVVSAVPAGVSIDQLVMQLGRG
jgi:hypothetical protein